jgi:hypothetical protein
LKRYEKDLSKKEDNKFIVFFCVICVTCVKNFFMGFILLVVIESGGEIVGGEEKEE